MHEAIMYEAIMYEAIIYEAILYEAIIYEAVLYEAIKHEAIMYETIMHEVIMYEAIMYEAIMYEAIMREALFGRIVPSRKRQYHEIPPPAFLVRWIQWGLWFLPRITIFGYDIYDKTPRYEWYRGTDSAISMKLQSHAYIIFEIQFQAITSNVLKIFAKV